jgi:hypothetical protein
MADESVSQYFSKNPDPKEKRVSEGDITPSQEQQPLPDSLPQSLIEWLARINQGYLAIDWENLFLKRSTSIHLSDFNIPANALSSAQFFPAPIKFVLVFQFTTSGTAFHR